MNLQPGADAGRSFVPNTIEVGEGKLEMTGGLIYSAIVECTRPCAPLPTGDLEVEYQGRGP